MSAIVDRVRGRATAARKLVARTPLLQGPLVTIAVAAGLHIALRLLSPYLFYTTNLAVCWPSVGLVLALLLLARRRAWPWICAGFVIYEAIADVRWMTPAGIAVDCLCNLFEVLLPAFCLPRFTGLSEWLRKPYLIVRFGGIGLIAAPGGAAFFSQMYFSRVLPGGYWNLLLHWLMSDSLGIALCTPLVLVLVSKETYRMFRRERLLETIPPMLLILVCCWIVFHQSVYPIAFILFPILVVVVNVVGFSGAVFCLNGLTVIAAGATIRGTGPFMFVAGAHEPYRMILLQIYLITAMVMSFAVTLIQLERNAAEQQLNLALRQMELLATHDSLTGVGNRRLFENSLETEWSRALREGRPVGLLLLDADCFKSYNDLYGHLAGDACLCLIASVLKPIVRREGDLAARYGGEEFVVLLPGSDLEDALRVGEDIRGQVEALAIAHSGNPYRFVTVSVGCSAIVPSMDTQPRELVREADQALYLAKHGGRNRVEAKEVPSFQTS